MWGYKNIMNNKIIMVLLYAAHYLRDFCSFCEAAHTFGMVWQVVFKVGLHTIVYLGTGNWLMTIQCIQYFLFFSFLLIIYFLLIGECLLFLFVFSLVCLAREHMPLRHILVRASLHTCSPALPCLLLHHQRPRGCSTQRPTWSTLRA